MEENIMKKRIIASLLVSALILSAASCGGGTSAPAPSTAAPADTNGASPAVTDSESGSGKSVETKSGTAAAATGTSAVKPEPGLKESAAGGSEGFSADVESPAEPAAHADETPAATEAAPAGTSAAYVPETTAAAPSTTAAMTTTAPALAKEDGAEGGRFYAEDYEMAEEAYDGGYDYLAEPSFAPEMAIGAVPDAMSDSAAEGMEYIAADDYDAYDYDWDWYGSGRQARAGLLTGGEWRDNSNYAFWCSLFGQREDWEETRTEWKIDTSDRVYVRVTGSDKRPAAGLTVKLASGKTLLWQSVTDSRGEAFLFPHVSGSGAVPDTILVESPDGGAWKQDLPKNYAETDTPYDITVSQTAPMRTQLDLMFMIDTTGSMGDELSYIQTELENVINRVSDNTNTDIQLSVNFYRDDGDDYVVRDFGFTSNISIAIDHLRDQHAYGGGDYEEAVEQAIDNALNDHKWRAGSEKLMFLVLDAPPHYSSAVQVMPGLMQSASGMGVRIIPVASSGVDTTTEFLCRSMALTTGGTYTFLTDDSGIGGSHLAPTIGSYEVEKLNDMLVRIISDYFTQGERLVPSSSQQSGQTGNSDNRDGVYAANYTYTNDYFSGSGYYKKGVLKSRNELDAFVKKYGFDFGGLGSHVDFNKECIAYNVELLSSGSIKVDDSKDVYVAYDGENLEFSYKLTRPEVGTSDIKTLFVYAAVPKM